jgi:surfactin synthase thioesterase subunit
VGEQQAMMTSWRVMETVSWILEGFSLGSLLSWELVSHIKLDHTLRYVKAGYAPNYKAHVEELEVMYKALVLT